MDEATVFVILLAAGFLLFVTYLAICQPESSIPAKTRRHQRKADGNEITTTTASGQRIRDCRKLGEGSRS